MSQISTERLLPNKTGINAAANALRKGAQVAVPTETVYGLAADARSDTAVAGIYAAKNRPSFNPLIVHLPSIEAVRDYVEWTDTAQKVADAFWPGPLTMVLPLKANAGLSKLVTAGLDSLAVRVPAHPVMQDLLKAFGGPIAAPSANPSGKISPSTADHVLAGLDGTIAAILDGGPCSVGVESTILGLTHALTLLRAGGIPSNALEAILGRPLAVHSGAIINAPGQLQSHYAPGAAVRLNATTWHPGELRLGFGPVEADLNLSPSGDLHEAAANLFAHLHALDARHSDVIAVSPIPADGLGAAINDRLARAAAPRS